MKRAQKYEIFALVTGAYGDRGGIAQSNRDILDALENMEAFGPISVFPRKAMSSFDKPSGKIKQRAPTMNKFIYIFRIIFEIIRSRSKRILFCGHFYMMPLAYFVKKIFGMPVWLHVHGIELLDVKSKKIFKYAEHAKLVTCVSRYSRRIFLEKVNIDPLKVKVLPNTFNEKFRYSAEPSELCKKWNLQDKKILLTVSRLSAAERYKGHDVIISCLPDLLKEFRNIVYLIAGEGDDRERLEKKAQVLGVGGAVRFTGYVADEDLPELYRLADMYVMPSTEEGFGIAFVEAAASGVAALGCNVDGSEDALQEGHLGKVVARNEVQAAIRGHLLNSHEKPQELSRRVYATFGKTLYRRHLSSLLLSGLLPKAITLK